MDNKMFCFQCEQAAHCTGCTGSAGVCGKSAETANLQDELTGALIGLARAADGSPGVNEGTWSLIIEALFTTLTNVNFDAAAIRDVTARVKVEKSRLVPDCASCMSPCGHNNDYDVSRLWTADEDIRSLKSLILFGIRGMAAYAYHAMVLGYTDGEVNRFFAKALFAIGEDWGMDDLLPLVLEVGEKNYRCITILQRYQLGIHVHGSWSRTTRIYRMGLQNPRITLTYLEQTWNFPHDFPAITRSPAKSRNRLPI